MQINIEKGTFLWFNTKEKIQILLRISIIKKTALVYWEKT